MRILDYQQRALGVFDAYMDALAAEKVKADRVQEINQAQELGLDPHDFPLKAWDAMRERGMLPQSRAGIPFCPRHDGINRPVPNAVFKVPTGGGKTFMACSALSRLFGRYLGRNNGFVLWIVPNEAIYSQTLRHLKNRQHPYRQMLDQIGAGRVRILEKHSSLHAQDVRENLCVMLLMLQSASRRTKERLKMFRDRGDVHGFFPDEGDQRAHRQILERVGNLDVYDTLGDANALSWTLIKDSLGNALRSINPVVVMDEGHRAVSDLAYETLYGFNPCFVLELTATPRNIAARGGRNPRPARHANVLVDIPGRDLQREGMIKMPMELDAMQESDWRTTLAAALERLDGLQKRANKLRANRNRYIRPIMLVQVERTGGDQRDGGHIHALDVREWLQRAGLDDAEIAVKTAAANDLKNPENLDLLSPRSRVRVIITRQALQEGWDCPFAYLLCSLAASTSLQATTQLVGRILRQPHAAATGDEALDRCYIITHHAQTGAVVEAVKQGLERDGLGDLAQQMLHLGDGQAGAAAPRRIRRRRAMRDLDIYLPQVLWAGDGADAARPLDYHTDILCRLDWRNLDTAPLVQRIPQNARPAERQMRHISLADGGLEAAPAAMPEPLPAADGGGLDGVYVVQMIADLVPNPWTAREIVAAMESGLGARGRDGRWMNERICLLVGELRRWLEERRDNSAEALFRNEVACGNIRFHLRADWQNWVMPKETLSTQPEGAAQLVGGDGQALARSLFAPIYRGDFSSADERNIAVHLDGEQALHWWHRNVARNQYALQGWRQGKIYPDFIFAMRPDDDGQRIIALETKGDHLAGNTDSEYKRNLLALLSKACQQSDATPVGELQLLNGHRTTMQCEMILMSEWRARLPALLQP